MRCILLLAISFALGACTPMEWRRDGEVASFEGKEYMQCRSRAMLDAMRMAPFPGFHSFPIVGRDSQGRPFVIHRGWSHTDQLMWEHMSMNECMAGLGFRLVPIAPDKK